MPSSCSDDPTDPISHALAVLTLSPILVIPAYLAVLVFEREATILCMLAGQVRLPLALL